MLITRYLIKNLFAATGFIVLTLTVVIWLTQSMKVLDLVANSDAPLWLFLKLVFLSLPRFLEIIFPLALVAAILFTYNRLIMENELIVMRACGIDQTGLAKPALGLAVALTAALLAFTTYLSPKSVAGLTHLRETVKAQYSAFLLREGVFNTFGDDLTVYLRRRDDAGSLYGLLIHDTRDKDKPPVTVTAKRGAITMNENIPTIVVYDGMRQQMDAGHGAVTKLYFSKYTIEIKSLESETAARWQDANERTLAELLRPDLGDPRDRAKAGLFRAEIYIRLITPFNAIAFALVALCCILLGPFNRRGQGMKIAAASALIVAGQALSLSLVNLARKNTGFCVPLYAATLAPIFLCLWLLRLPGEQALMRGLRRWRLGRAVAA